ncbi:MAG: metallophosphoesterase family protein [Rikenellaceae bacterium]
MVKVGVVSDTHGYFDAKLEAFFDDIDILIHAGDIGDLDLADRLEGLYNFKAVYGNIDNHKVRIVYKRDAIFNIEGVKLFVTHIGGYPQHYYQDIKPIIKKERPNIVVCGHSHILKVIYDKELDHLHINPGAAGIKGFHKVRTAIRFKIDGDKILDMEVGEWKRG